MAYDFYDLLGVSEDASQDEIKDAFRDKVQEVHPDLNDDPRAPAQFTALKKGYDTLKDPVERKAYDRLGHKDYVAKRLEGLPSADQWKPADSDGSASDGSAATGGASSASSATSGTTAGASGSGTTDGSSTRTTSATGTAGATGTTGASTGTGGTGGTGRGSGGSTTSTSASGTATGAGTSSSATTGTRTGTTASTRTGTTSASGAGTGSAADAATGSGAESDDGATSTADGPGLIDRLRSINYGWPLVFLTTLVYAVGVGMYARENLDALRELAAQVRASGTDAAALREALLAADYGLVPVFEFVRTTVLIGSAPGPGVLIAIGAVLMPAIFIVVVRTTRKAFAWQPTYLYVAAVLAPLTGLGANAGGIDRPVLTVVAFGLLPLGAVVTLLFNAFVTPRLKRLF
ncbi:DnaJ domain-containing protein [Halostella sp. JP-L12]|uniref:J domain-containing protein n=1 Tax=Halostella TaxID=1843185 RepID=UPI000EF78F02|nr:MULTISPECIES: DnaJ domain-containing protein [Halostella]NHN49758.1 DnaJ domain-containing protein [Halostella sp. JP-L12]